MIEAAQRKRDLQIGTGLSLLAFCVYLAFPTRNYYWDGITFSLNIEDSHRFTQLYFNPNHLLYDSVGYVLLQAFRTVLPTLRALTLLVTINQILGAASAFLIFQILNRFTQDRYTKVCFTLIFVFSATWWKFSTDADVYVPSTFCLIVAYFMLTNPDRRPNLVAIGLLHALAMLLHQIAIFFYVPALTAILLCGHWQTTKEKLRSAMQYTLTAGSTVAIAYILVWFGIVNRDGIQPPFHGLLKWITFNGTEEYIFQSVPHSLLKTAQSTVRVFFGGQLKLAREFVAAPVLVLLCLLIIACGIFFVAQLCRYGMNDRGVLPAKFLRSDALVCLSWAAPFLAFLLFWLTEWPYYRLFYLPAIVGLLAYAVERLRRVPDAKQSYALAGFAAIMILSNFTFLIYPYAQSSATPPTHLAMSANTVWDGDSVVFYRNVTSDNRLFRYFNQQAHWETVNTDLDKFKTRLCLLNSDGYKTWIDVTGLDYLSSFPSEETWLSNVELHDSIKLLNSRHWIRFMQVIPNCDPYNDVNDAARISEIQ